MIFSDGILSKDLCIMLNSLAKRLSSSGAGPLAGAVRQVDVDANTCSRAADRVKELEHAIELLLEASRMRTPQKTGSAGHSTGDADQLSGWAPDDDAIIKQLQVQRDNLRTLTKQVRRQTEINKRLVAKLGAVRSALGFCPGSYE